MQEKKKREEGEKERRKSSSLQSMYGLLNYPQRVV